MFLVSLFRKASPASAIENDIAGAVEASTPAPTNVAKDFYLSNFNDFSSETEIAIDLKTSTPEKFDDTLRNVSHGLRKKMGDQYKKFSYLSAMAA